jgi:hypothetical protein
MQFLHKIAKSLEIVDAAISEARDTGNSKKVSEYSKLRASVPPDQSLCKFYDTKIHVHYPGDQVAESTFVPFSYQMGPAGGIAIIDGASGLVDRAKLLALDQSQRDALGMSYSVDFSDRPRLSDLYAASVYPTEADVKKLVTSKGGDEAKAMDEMSRGKFSIKLSKLIQDLATKPADTPIVIYYPVCRFIGDEPRIENAARLSRAFSLTQSEKPRGGPMRRQGTGVLETEFGLPSKGKGGKRKTYRKKKFRTQTRKRRQ